MERLTEKIAILPLPVLLLLLTSLTCLHVYCKYRNGRFFRLLSDLLESLIVAFVLVFMLLRPFVVQSFYIPSGSMHPTLWEGDRILVNKWSYRFHPPQYGDLLVFRAPQNAAWDEREFIKRLIGMPGDLIEVREGYIQVGTDSDSRFASQRPLRFTRSEILNLLGAGGSISEESQATPQPLRLTSDSIRLGDRQIGKEEFAALAGRPNEPVTIQPGQVVRNGDILMEEYIAEDAQYHMDAVVVPPGHFFVLGDNRNQSTDSHAWGMLPADRVIGRAEVVFWPTEHIKRLVP